MTARGRTLAVMGAAMFVFGRLTGMRELMMAGTALGAVLLFGFAAVWFRRGTVSSERRLSTTRTSVGHSVRVELTIRASGSLGLGPVLLSDRIPPRIGSPVRLSLPAGSRRRERKVAYRLVPRLRGRYQIGPLEITHTDPFGAVSVRRTMRGASTLVVYPSYENASILPAGVHRLGIVRHSPLVGQGDEFYALRTYEEGDDLRKVHWPSSMKTGELVVRQEELLAEPRALVVLDTCSGKHRGRGTSASIEAAVSVCASVGVLALRRRMRLDVVTADGPLLDAPTPSEDRFLEALAVLRPSRRRDLVRAVERSGGKRPAVTIVVTPGLNATEMRAVALRAHGSAGGALVHIDAASFGPRGPARRGGANLAALGMPVVPLRAGESFRTAWLHTLKDAALAR